MGGLLVGYYSMSKRKMLKWWKKVFWRLLDICIVNSLIIYQTNFPASKIKNQKLFCQKLVKELFEPLLALHASPDCPVHLSLSKQLSVSYENRLVGKHFPYKE